MWNPINRVILIVIACCVPVLADGFDSKVVDAEAKWLVFIDAKLMRSNPVARTMRAKHLEHKNTVERMAQMKTKLGLASWDDLESILFYARNDTPGDGVLIIKARSDLQATVDLLKDKPNYRSGMNEDRQVHFWTYTTRYKEVVQAHTVRLMFFPGDYIVLARNSHDFDAAVRVLDGEISNLANGDAHLRGDVPMGASIYVEAAGPIERHGHRHHPQILKHVEHLRLSLVHGVDDTSIQGTMELFDAETALQFEQILEGLRAMMQLKHDAKDAAGNKSLLGTMGIEVTENTLRVNWPMSNQMLMDLIQRHADHHRRKQDEQRNRQDKNH